MKQVLISIQPKWVEKIASGKKTIEVRKTRPKLETPFKCYIYCTEGDALAYPYLTYDTTFDYYDFDGIKVCLFDGYCSQLLMYDIDGSFSTFNIYDYNATEIQVPFEI